MAGQFGRCNRYFHHFAQVFLFKHRTSPFNAVLDTNITLSYSNLIMPADQMLNSNNAAVRATTRQRLTAGVIFLSIAAFFAISLLTAHRKINLWPFPCSFKQQYNLPCPTCGMTAACLAFVRGKIFDAFLIQPAAAFLCVALAICGFLAFLVACFGVYFSFLNRLFEEIKIRHIVLATYDCSRRRLGRYACPGYGDEQIVPIK